MDSTIVELRDLKAMMVLEQEMANKYYAVLDSVMSATHAQDTEDTTVMLQIIAMLAQNKQNMIAFQA